MADKYSAVWVSHSSMGDFLKCPRAYFLHNVYKDPTTRRKISIVSPAMSLGTAVHEVIEGLGSMKAEDRFKNPQALYDKFEEEWKKVSGKKGGFTSTEEEAKMKARGRAMIERVIAHPGPLLEKTVKFGSDNSDDMLPYFFLSPDENIILCGKVDWLVYTPADDSLQVLDFKTGKNEEKGDSLQLPIYRLLLDKLQKRKVTGASYWYLDRDDMPTLMELPDMEKSLADVLATARMVKKARDQAKVFGADMAFRCPKGPGGCSACQPYEAILKGEAEHIGVGGYNQDLYMI
jgi:ATP-dependent helicase/DNAse subunit B